MKYQICAEQRVSAMILNSEIHNCSQQSMELSPKLNHILSHEAILCKCRNIKVASSILFIHDGPKLEISFRRKFNSWRVNHHTWLLNEWVMKQILRSLELNENENISEPVRYSEKSREREIYFNKFWYYPRCSK